MEKFYNRKNELELLGKIERQSENNACFTVLTGRRRVGKTALVKEFLKGKRGAYLFIVKTSEPLLCREWQKILEEQLSLKIFGTVSSLSDLFAQVFEFSKSNHFSLVIDEFQELENVNRSFFSSLQNLWDSAKGESKINLIVSGSVYSMMTKIFEGQKEPLFGRATHKMNIKPFTPSVIKEILADFNPNYMPEDLLCLYMLSGGVPKYIFLLMYAGAFSKDTMLSYALGETSPFLIDGKEILVSEIGKDYGIYFSVLRLISEGLTCQSEIDSVIQKNTGSYLKNLEENFGVIKPMRPLFSKPASRNARYQITDCYLRFFFRFVYSNQSLIEFGQHDTLKEIVLRDYETFSGKSLEQYFTSKIQEERKLTSIGGWWDRKSQNEIDIIAINALEKTCCIYEVKRQAKKIDMELLGEKARQFSKNIPGYTISLAGLSMEDM